MYPRNINRINAGQSAVLPVSRSCSNWCDPGFFKSVFSVKDICCPLTLKKPMWWLVTTVLAGGVVALEVTTGALSTAANYENFGLMAFLYGIDPIVQSVNILTASYPPALSEVDAVPSISSDEDGFVTIDLHNDNAEVAVVIPAHTAGDKIVATIRSCLNHVRPGQIYIIDNGNSEYPLDNTKDIVADISHEINYVWGHIGNKTFAQFIGCLVAKEYKYIYTSDDDMRMPDNFSFGLELLDENCKAICYPIVAVHPEPGHTNILTRWQSLEYKLSGCAKLSQARFGGVLYPHGAASLWDREVLLKVLEHHDAVFYAEDVKLGMILTRLGYTMKIAAGASLETEAPTTLFGPFPNFYQQRVRSWEMGRQFYFFKFASQLFTVRPPTSSFRDAFFFKFAEAYNVYSNAVDWMRFPLFLLMLRNPSYWIRVAALLGGGVLPVLLWNYAKLPLNKRADLQSSFLDVITFPAFKLLESAMSVGGIGRLLSVYGPNYVKKPDVLAYKKDMLADQASLQRQIQEFDRAGHVSTQSYRKVMYGRFFQPIHNVDELERAFDESAHDAYLDAVIEAGNERRELAVAQNAEEIDEQFVATATSVVTIV